MYKRVDLPSVSIVFYIATMILKGGLMFFNMAPFSSARCTVNGETHACTWNPCSPLLTIVQRISLEGEIAADRGSLSVCQRFFYFVFDAPIHQTLFALTKWVHAPTLDHRSRVPNGECFFFPHFLLSSICEDDEHSWGEFGWLRRIQCRVWSTPRMARSFYSWAKKGGHVLEATLYFMQQYRKTDQSRRLCQLVLFSPAHPRHRAKKQCRRRGVISDINLHSDFRGCIYTWQQ